MSSENIPNDPAPSLSSGGGDYGGGSSEGATTTTTATSGGKGASFFKGVGKSIIGGARKIGERTAEVASSTVKATKGATKEITTKVNKDTIAQMGRRGKHAIITTVGKTKASKDVGYELKHRTAHNSLMILSDLYKEFNLFVKHAAAIADRYQAVADLLEKFRRSCDGYIEMETTEEGGYMEEEGELGGSGANNEDEKKKRRSTSPVRDQFDGGAKVPTVSGDAELAGEKTAVIQESMKKIRDVTEEMQMTLTGSCMSLLTNTMKNLEDETTRVQGGVIKASVDYDLTRDEVTKLQKDVDKLRESLNRSEDHVYALSPQVKEAVRQDCLDKERKLQDMKFDMEEQKEQFQRQVLDGRTDLLFSLEQTSMATWSCFNILFHQMQRFFGDISEASEPAATAMITLKNNQTVAKAIDRDRKKKLATARQEAEERVRLSGGVTTTSGGSPKKKVTGSGSGAPSSFDDLFADFMDSRKETIPELPPLPSSSSSPSSPNGASSSKNGTGGTGGGTQHNHFDPFAGATTTTTNTTTANNQQAASSKQGNGGASDGLDFFN